MRLVTRIATLALLTISGLGCGEESLPGTWNSTVTTSQGYTFNEVLVLNSGGTGSITLTAAGSCTGSQNTTGLTWDASGNSITFAGATRCTGTVTCTPSGETTPVIVECTTIAPYYLVGSCNYSLTNSNNTLTLSNCTSAPMAAATFNRAL
jgi:hypothetical protein